MPCESNGHRSHGRTSTKQLHACGPTAGGDHPSQPRTSNRAGAANNQLATPADGDALQRRGICYLPDYLVNAGGIISVAREYRGEGEETAVMAEVSKIAERVEELLQRVQTADSTPARVADDWARSKLVRLS